MAYSNDMRVTGGRWRGHPVRVPGRRVLRPTQDRVREALFAMLAGRIEGARFVDLFAGTGAVGIEALSRGAAQVCWVERDVRVLAVLRQNLRELGAPQDTIVRADVGRALAGGLLPEACDVVFADPPYRVRRRRPWLDTLLETLPRCGVLRPDGCFVMEQAAGDTVACPQGWQLVRDRAYGDSRLLLFARDEEGGEQS